MQEKHLSLNIRQSFWFNPAADCLCGAPCRIHKFQTKEHVKTGAKVV
jgi:hypothetical protein